MIDQSFKYKNWREYTVKKSKTNCVWDYKNIDVVWEELDQTNEINEFNLKDSISTNMKHQLAVLHKSWNIHSECVKHYMSFEPELKDGLESILDSFRNKCYSYNLIKLTSGRQIVWHFDTYATFIKRNKVENKDWDKIKRSLVMLTPWDFGHVIQVGNSVLSHWEAGDTYTWSSDDWHGVANFGKNDWIAAQVTFIE